MYTLFENLSRKMNYGNIKITKYALCVLERFGVECWRTIESFRIRTRWQCRNRTSVPLVYKQPCVSLKINTPDLTWKINRLNRI